jgi:hypothetical protein
MISKFDRYIAILSSARIEYDLDAAEEIRTRLRQVEYAISELNEYISRYCEFERGLLHQDKRNLVDNFLKESDKIFFKGQFYAEAFYYFSFRVYKKLNRAEVPLPFLNGFKCRGVVSVRNHLIEHPEGKSSEATGYSYCFSESYGAVLRAANDSNQKVRDKGSILNFQEFRENFIRKIDAAIEQCG